jgi:hypothetical protein
MSNESQIIAKYNKGEKISKSLIVGYLSDNGFRFETEDKTENVMTFGKRADSGSLLYIYFNVKNKYLNGEYVYRKHGEIHALQIGSPRQLIQTIKDINSPFSHINLHGAYHIGNIEDDICSILHENWLNYRSSSVGIVSNTRLFSNTMLELYIEIDNEIKVNVELNYRTTDNESIYSEPIILERDNKVYYVKTIEEFEKLIIEILESLDVDEVEFSLPLDSYTGTGVETMRNSLKSNKAVKRRFSNRNKRR